MTVTSEWTPIIRTVTYQKMLPLHLCCPAKLKDSEAIAIRTTRDRCCLKTTIWLDSKAKSRNCGKLALTRVSRLMTFGNSMAMPSAIIPACLPHQFLLKIIIQRPFSTLLHRFVIWLANFILLNALKIQNRCFSCNVTLHPTWSFFNAKNTQLDCLIMRISSIKTTTNRRTTC